MKLPRDLKGEELAKHLCKHWEYIKIHQVGSHIILQTETPTPHRIAVPAHNPLRIGTLNAILAAVAAQKRIQGSYSQGYLEHFRNTRRLFQSSEKWLFVKGKAT